MKDAGTGIVIVSYNSEDFLGPCLTAALSFCPQVLVVDNASADGSRRVVRSHPPAILIDNPINLGFAAAVNQGIRALDAEFVLLLNPDAILETPIEPLVEACCWQNAAAACGKLVHADGSPQAGFAVRRFPTVTALAFESLGLNRVWPSNPVNRRYRCLGFDFDRAQPVEQPAGAFLMIRKSVWAKLGGFDESFFPLWFEEVDFLRRAAALGHRVYYTPEATAVHHGGHSLARIPEAASRWYWYDNLLRFSAKHFRLGFRAVSAAVLLGVAARCVVGAMKGGEARSGYGKVMRSAGRALLRGRAQAGLRNDSRPDVEPSTQSDLTNSHTHGL